MSTYQPRIGDGVSHLFHPETGRFLFKGKKLGICAACDAKDYTYPVGAMRPSYVFCRQCITKQGARELRKESNKALATVIGQSNKAREDLDQMSVRYRARFNTEIDWRK